MGSVISASRGAAAILTAAFIVAATTLPAAGETDCKSWFLGVCTSRFTPAEQAKVNSRNRLEALLRDPARASPELERRLREQVNKSAIPTGFSSSRPHPSWRYRAAGDGRLGNRPRYAWRPSYFRCNRRKRCWHGGRTRTLVPLGTSVESSACYGISKVLGAAVLRLTSGIAHHVLVGVAQAIHRRPLAFCAR
jgi:hypothetical protein